MKLGDLLDRAFEILGDERSAPEFFDRDHIVDLINEGCSIFRRQAEDEWYRQDIPAVAGTAIYNWPAYSVRGLRVAFDDETMTPTSVQELLVHDALWQTRDAEHPRKWTTQGLPHNQWLAYPYPSVTTDGEITFSGNTGIPNRVVEGAITATPVADPLVPGWNPNFGMANRIYSSGNDPTVLGTEGRMGYAQQSNVAQFTLWGVKRPFVMVSDESEVPIKNAYQLAPLWYALSESYDEEGDRHNPILAAYYRDKFADTVMRGVELSKNPAPFMVHVLRPVGGGEPGGDVPSPWPSQVIADGVPVNVGFPRQGFWGL